MYDKIHYKKKKKRYGSGTQKRGLGNNYTFGDQLQVHVLVEDIGVDKLKRRMVG